MNRKYEFKMFDITEDFSKKVEEEVLMLKEKYNFYLTSNLIIIYKSIQESVIGKDHNHKIILYFNPNINEVSAVIYAKNFVKIFNVKAENKFAFGFIKSLIKKYNALEERMTNEDIANAYK